MLVIDVTLDPTLVRLGSLALTWHGLVSALAILSGVQLGLLLARWRGLPEHGLQQVVWWAIPASIIGARLFHVLDHLPAYCADPLAVLIIWRGGIAVYGAFLGGLAGTLLAARRAGLPRWTLLDAVAPAILVGQAIGRAGCLLNGDTVGRPTGGNWGIAYWHPDAVVPHALLGVPTHPYPLSGIA